MGNSQDARVDDDERTQAEVKSMIVTDTLQRKLREALDRETALREALDRSQDATDARNGVALELEMALADARRLRTRLGWVRDSRDQLADALAAVLYRLPVGTIAQEYVVAARGLISGDRGMI